MLLEKVYFQGLDGSLVDITIVDKSLIILGNMLESYENIAVEFSVF